MIDKRFPEFLLYFFLKINILFVILRLGFRTNDAILQYAIWKLLLRPTCTTCKSAAKAYLS